MGTATYATLTLDFADADHIATITLRRPETLNAMSRDLVLELRDALDAVAAAFPVTRALILTGEGRGFCSGADMRSMVASVTAPSDTPRRATDWDDRGNVVMLAAAVQAIPQPVIGAVNGVAVGGGLGLACSCDILIASEEARFGAVFVKRGLVPDTGSSVTLPRLVSAGVMAEMSFTGRIYDAAWAERRGIVNEVVPADQLMDAARALACEIAANPPLTLRNIKRVLHEPIADLAGVIRHESESNGDSIDSADRREALRAFAEKRAPAFHGR
ncbi:MAG: enoyl-CoA hydratase-related protein [Chloroflexi bacterium]|nr:enoyl-CoA hydratase-related protein [Chloroflexota bacterium]